MIEWLFTFLALYFLYRLIFDFIVPVAKASAQVRSKVNDMHRQQQQAQQQYTHQQTTKTNVRPPSDDYIDFEEIK